MHICAHSSREMILLDNFQAIEGALMELKMGDQTQFSLRSEFIELQ
jgi:hypothetical protein